MIIGIVGLKGGVGSSTLAVNLATYLSSRYDDVTLVEGDETGYNSLDYWGEARQSKKIPFGIIRMSEEDIQEATRENVKLRDYLMYNTGTHNDVVVIDVNRTYSKLRLLAFSAADVVLLPVNAGTHIAEERLAEINLVLEAADSLPERRHLHVRLLKNDSAIHPSEIDGYMQFENYGLKFMGTEVKARDAVRVAFDKGLGVTEYDPQSPAAHELRLLVDEIMELPQHS